jgi:predicted DNA-binding transcriptional regulator AlpA
MERLLTVEEYCEKTGLTRGQAANQRYLGTGPRFVRVTGKQIRYREGDVESWLQERTFTRTDVSDRARSTRSDEQIIKPGMTAQATGQQRDDITSFASAVSGRRKRHMT